MRQEVFEIVQKMDLSQVENRLALQCAPVIKGIKISNLLSVWTSDESLVRFLFTKTGLIHYRLLRMKDKTIFLIFRMEQLSQHLQKAEVRKLLKENGYNDFSLSGILGVFQSRYQGFVEQKQEFPHEMGILLGYPIEDVIGFITHNGKNYLYSGYWKVYKDVKEKQRLFNQYEKAKEELVLLLAEGYDIHSIMKLYSYNSKNQETEK